MTFGTTNRTIVELKQGTRRVVIVIEDSTNRTIVELKRDEANVAANSNVTYQSYHSGIETSNEAMQHIQLSTTNRTIVELKQA